MGEEEILGLTPEQLSELRELERMFESVGWMIFIREQQRIMDVLREGTLDHCKTLEDLWLLRGTVNALRTVIGYQDTITARKMEEWQVPTEPA